MEPRLGIRTGRSQIRWLALLICCAVCGPVAAAPLLVPSLDSTTTYRAWQSPALPANCNLHAVVTETLANRLISRTDTDTRAIRDVIMRARVFGTQTTDTRLTVDFQQAPHNAFLLMQLQGVTRSNIIGVRQEAQVNTWGCYRFDAFKPVYFDGKLITTSAPMAHVNARNTNRGVRSPVTGTPLVGPLVDRFIYAQAEQMRPQSEAIAAKKLAREVLPRFNGEIDQQLADLNRQLQTQVIAPLQELRLLPEFDSIATTHDALRYSARLPTGADDETSPAHPPAVQTGNMLCLHESLFAVAVEQFDVRGRELTAEDLRRVSETLAAIGLTEEGDELDVTGPPVTVFFDETDPLRVRIAEGRIEIVARVRIQPALGNPLPVQRLNVTLIPELQEDALVIQPGPIDVNSIDEFEQPGMDMMQGLIRQQVERLLRPVRITRAWKPPLDELEGAALSLREFVAQDGWLVIGFE